ncbi:MAG TPA: hypothetical protein VKX96_05870, partial [Chloroflexota bacterium]|nr:hypothetical protein [Chloroflexota bacterium]
MEIPLWFPNSQGTMLSTLLIAPDGWLDVPVVILCRGDNSPLADGQDLQIGHALADRGIASVLLDFSAASFPSGPLDQAALTRPIEDLGSTLDVLRLQRDVNVGQIGVSGSRLAGTVALLRAAIDPRIRTLVLRAALAPANQLPIEPLKIPTLLLVGNQDQSVLKLHHKSVLPSEGCYGSPIARGERQGESFTEVRLPPRISVAAKQPK